MRLLIALCSIVFSATSFAADPAKPNYYPLAKGTRWEYRLSADERTIEMVCEITETEVKNGRMHARVEGRLSNSVTLGEELSMDANGVYRNAILGAKLHQPVPIIKYPIKARDGWKDNIKIGEFSGKFDLKIKDTAAEIEVPAGKFKTLAVESATEMNGEKVVACIWYADGVGIVRQETMVGSNTITMELKKFTPAK